MHHSGNSSYVIVRFGPKGKATENMPPWPRVSCCCGPELNFVQYYQPEATKAFQTHPFTVSIAAQS